MNDVVQQPAPLEEVPLTDEQRRNKLRAGLIGTKQKVDTQLVTAFGFEIELRQATLDSMLKGVDTNDTRTMLINYLINNAFVPDTDLCVFEEGDRPQILAWPYGPEFKLIQEAMNSLMGVDIAEAEAAIKKDPLEPHS